MEFANDDENDDDELGLGEQLIRSLRSCDCHHRQPGVEVGGERTCCMRVIGAVYLISWKCFQVGEDTLD